MAHETANRQIEAAPESENQGCVDLWNAVIHEMASNAIDPLKGRFPKDLDASNRYRARINVKDQAISWFTRPDPQFLWICMLLGYSPSLWRHKVLSSIQYSETENAARNSQWIKPPDIRGQHMNGRKGHNAGHKRQGGNGNGNPKLGSGRIVEHSGSCARQAIRRPFHKVLDRSGLSVQPGLWTAGV